MSSIDIPARIFTFPHPRGRLEGKVWQQVGSRLIKNVSPADRTYTAIHYVIVRTDWPMLEGTAIAVATNFIWDFYVIIKTPNTLIFHEKARRETRKSAARNAEKARESLKNARAPRNFANHAQLQEPLPSLNDIVLVYPPTAVGARKSWQKRPPRSHYGDPLALFRAPKQRHPPCR